MGKRHNAHCGLELTTMPLWLASLKEGQLFGLLIRHIDAAALRS